ncbi:MAG: biotin/lipoyl-binding protein [Oligoflexales bacterium]|nr:biotin/lipoyl-binding protein [Oligoflexales bacterium]
MQRKIKRVFIANRGEICRRVAHTAHALGIQSVCARAKNSTPPLFLSELIDEFAIVDEESPAFYLSAERLIELALQYGCDSLHPGFGFLSEKASFAKKVIENGLIWIGPSPLAMESMASKENAKILAEKAKVPCLPGLKGLRLSSDQKKNEHLLKELESFSEQAGFPLIVKASMGGGGKGMRLVHKRGELMDALKRASSEALHAFGDDSLILEKYLAASRHIEVQILADSHGQVSAIGSRDCSLQRRHQKIIEESPAPGLREETQKALYASAVQLASSIGYESAGTVEFLLDSTSPIEQAQKFYFLEMNTRLQVEHPVSEEVFGLDLVAWQFRVAQGEALPPRLLKPETRGHCVEARLYAEDPEQDFFPAPALVRCFKPAQGPHVRWEVGIDSLDEVSARFDPMMAKVIAWGEDRPSALRTLAHSLRRTLVVGPTSNKEFLIHLLESSPFKEAPVDTHFISSKTLPLLSALNENRAQYEGLAQEFLQTLEQAKGSFFSQGEHIHSESSIDLKTKNIFGSSDALPDQKPMSKVETGQGKGPLDRFDLLTEERVCSRRPEHSPVTTGMGYFHPENQSKKGRPLQIFYSSWSSDEADHYLVQLEGYSFKREKAKKTARTLQGQNRQGGSSSDRTLKAPVPGRIVKVQTREGAHVEAQETLIVLESMKMEFQIAAPFKGSVLQVHAKEGQQVTAGQILVELETPKNQGGVS